MRKDVTPQVETREIADAELDGVAGGLVAAPLVGQALGLAGSVAPVGAVTGVAMPVVGEVTGLAAGMTGIAGF